MTIEDSLHPFLQSSVHVMYIIHLESCWNFAEVSRLTNCQGLALTIKELPILSREKSEKYGDVKE